MAHELAVSAGTNATRGPSGRRIGDLFGALLLHLPLALLVFVLALLVYGLGLPETSALIYLAGGVLIWLTLAAVLVRWWASGRPTLWEVPLAWLLLAWLAWLVIPLLFWPRCRRWLARSCTPWRGSPPDESESHANVVWQIVALVAMPSLFVYGPLFVMSASGLIGEHTFQETYGSRDVSFSYPSEFRKADAAQRNTPPGQIDAIFLSYMGDPDSGVVFQVLGWDAPDDLAVEGEIPDSTMDELAAEWQEVTGFEGFLHRHIARLPALSATVPVPTRSFAGADVWYTTTAIFDLDADLIYVVGCQYEAQHRADIEAACDQVLSSFELSD